MNRRSFIKGLIGVSAALILPPEPERRFWALDQTMIPETGSYDALLRKEMLRVKMEMEQRIFSVTTIPVNHPERFYGTDRAIMVNDEIMWIREFNPDGSFDVDRYNCLPRQSKTPTPME